MRPRVRAVRVFCLGALVILLVSSGGLLLPGSVLALPSPDTDERRMEELCQRYEDFDINRDGLIEIRRLEPVVKRARGADAEAERGTIVVLVESRLLQAEAPGPRMRPLLARYAGDLAAGGYRAFVTAASVYKGSVHQDGRTVLALRRFFQDLDSEFPDFAGAVLVGNFPEACIVRQYYWHKKGTITIQSGDEEKRFEDAAYVRDRAELVAARTDLVLADLDGKWEEVYRQAEQALPYFIAVYPDGTRTEELVTPHYELGEDRFEDFFFVQDGRWKQEKAGEGEVRFRRGGATNPECSEADLECPNPMARPEIAVSRINAYHAGVRPRRDIEGASGKGLLDDDGMPREVIFPEGAEVPRGVEVWEHDPALERRLLKEFFDRNHRYRQGHFEGAHRPASLTTGFPSALPDIKGAFQEWSDFSRDGYNVSGSDTTLLDAVRWLKRPAVLRHIMAHSDPWGTTFGEAPGVKALEKACGGRAWNWVTKGRKLVPGLFGTPDKLDFAIHRTLWANGKLPECAAMYLHGGCESITPQGASRHRYNHPKYGYWQGGESLMFHCNGVVLLGRSKVFYDTPRGAWETLADGGNWGDVWRRYYEVESSADNIQKVGGGIGRKRAYFWSLLGDWTLSLYPEKGR